jgi:hypothetical protein
MMDNEPPASTYTLGKVCIGHLSNLYGSTLSMTNLARQSGLEQFPVVELQSKLLHKDSFYGTIDSGSSLSSL